MSYRKLASGYAVFVGAMMIVWWGVLLSQDQMPELAETPIAAVLHIAAEMSTAVCLMASGAGLWIGRPWADRLLPVGLGMLLYAMIQASGYSAQQGQTPVVVLFVLLTAGALYLLLNRGWQEAAGSGGRA